MKLKIKLVWLWRSTVLDLNHKCIFSFTKYGKKIFLLLISNITLDLNVKIWFLRIRKFKINILFVLNLQMWFFYIKTHLSIYLIYRMDEKFWPHASHHSLLSKQRRSNVLQFVVQKRKTRTRLKTNTKIT